MLRCKRSIAIGLMLRQLGLIIRRLLSLHILILNRNGFFCKKVSFLFLIKIKALYIERFIEIEKSNRILMEKMSNIIKNRETFRK